MRGLQLLYDYRHGTENLLFGKIKLIDLHPLPDTASSLRSHGVLPDFPSKE